MARRSLRADDKRRSGAGSNVTTRVGTSDNGKAKALASLFNDRRRPNGRGKKAR